MVKLIALFSRPEDVEGFDMHFADIHIPLVKKLPGLRRIEVARIIGAPIGETPSHLLSEMYFDSKGMLDEALASPSGKAAAKDLISFAGKYVTLMIAEVSFREEIPSFGD